ncbi:helix-turn-helix domain-containing protein [Azospirillum brasilense]|uniref:helix-turn-helix domain-containing protein n=1 Tax=Azospirillum brasilense TaxID=192 RepID=UPI003D7D9561
MARQENKRRVAARMFAIAHALEGMSRAEAARLAGMDRQALRDAVVRYNAEGAAGLYDRPLPDRPEWPSASPRRCIRPACRASCGGSRPCWGRRRFVATHPVQKVEAFAKHGALHSRPNHSPAPQRQGR